MLLTYSTRHRLALTAIVAAAIWSLLGWQQLGGGVPSHSFLARDDMPAISNWWGALVLPLLTWFAIGDVQARIARGAGGSRTALLGFAGGALYGAVLAGAYSLGFAAIPSFQLQALPFIAIVVPIFRVEVVLGFVIAMSYTFGAVLPTVIGTLLACVGAAVYLAPRWLVRRVRGGR